MEVGKLNKLNEAGLHLCHSVFKVG